MKPILTEADIEEIRKEAVLSLPEPTDTDDQDAWTTQLEDKIAQLAAQKGYEKKEKLLADDLESILEQAKQEGIELGKKMANDEWKKYNERYPQQSTARKLVRERLIKIGRNEAYNKVLDMSLLPYQIEHIKKLKEQGTNEDTKKRCCKKYPNCTHEEATYY